MMNSKLNLRIWTILALMLLFGNVKSQNLVPNGDMESNTACPTSASYAASIATGWATITNHGGTADYFHSCGAALHDWTNFANDLSITPHSGNGYIGMGTHSDFDQREYSMVQLSSPLVAGQNYTVEMWVLNAKGDYSSDVYTNNIGMFLSVGQPTATGCGMCVGVYNVIPQVNETTVVGNQWTLITCVITAVGGEEWLVVGNFFDNASTTITPNGALSMSLPPISAYTFIDDVVVESTSDPVGCGPVACDATITQVGPYCENDGIVNLSAIDPNGVWSGVGITNASNGVFDPGVAGAGSWEITYTLPMCNDTMIIVVNPLPNTGSDGAITLCATSPSVDLFSFLGNGADVGGVWSPVMNSTTGVFDPSIDVATTYTYTVSNSCGISSNDVVVTISANLIPGTSGVISICGNAVPVDLFNSLGGGASVGGTWSPILVSGTGIFDPVVDVAGTYTYTILDCFGNPQSADVVVTLIQLPNTGIDGSISLCSTDPAIDLFLQLGGAATAGGVWLPTLVSGTGMFDPAVDVATTYTYSLSNVCGTSSNSIVVTVDPCVPPVSLFILSDDTICEGDCISLTDYSTGASSWLWTINNGTPSSSTDQSPSNICFNTSGTFSIQQEAINNYGTDVTTLTIVVLPTPLLLISPDVTIDLGESANLSVSGATGNYIWSPLTGLNCSICNDPVSTPKTTTTYTVSFTDDYGCSASDHLTVFVDTEISIYIPNTFTPNNDGLNDEFFAKMNIDFKDDFELLIFNRWGNLLFESNSVLNGWDGTYKGSKVPSGVYVYIISYHNKGKSSIIKKKGMISLLR